MTERPVLFEPAAAVAVSICLTARTIADGRTDRHPRPCGWCDWPVEELQRMLAGFNAWAERDERSGRYGRHDAAVFQGLTRREQAELVLTAQAFPESPVEPMATPDAPPAHVDEEDGPGKSVV